MKGFDMDDCEKDEWGSCFDLLGGFAMCTTVRLDEVRCGFFLARLCISTIGEFSANSLQCTLYGHEKNSSLWKS